MESESHASRIVSAIKIYDTLERSALKIHRRVFVSCSRAKGCNFCGLLTFCSETFLEKLSPLNALRNYGDRWGKLRRVRKHESHPAASLRWLARKIFFWPIRSRQFKRFWNWFSKSKCPGARLDLTVNFHHEHFIDPTNFPWVSEDEIAHTLKKISFSIWCVNKSHFFTAHLSINYPTRKPGKL